MSQQTQAALIRDATVAALVAANTLAGVHVESDRSDPTSETDCPRIIIDDQRSMTDRSKKLTNPSFDVDQTLHIVGSVSGPLRDDVRRDLDTLEAQILDALLTNPDWRKLAENPASIAIGREYKQGGLILGDVHFQIRLSWRETYRPVLTQTLNQVAMVATPPHATKTTPPVAATVDFTKPAQP